MPERPRNDPDEVNSGSRESGDEETTDGSSGPPGVTEGQRRQAVEEGWDEAEPMEGEAPTG